jgi:hypothetical protein
MEKDMNGVLFELFRPKTWATLRLIEFWQSLGDEHGVCEYAVSVRAMEEPLDAHIILMSVVPTGGAGRTSASARRVIPTRPPDPPSGLRTPRTPRPGRAGHR